MSRNLSDLQHLSEDKRIHVVKSLSALSKFLGIHSEFLNLVKDYGFKWSVKNDDLIIARFTKNHNPNEIFEWIRKVKQSCPELSCFMDFISVSGLRFEEAVESFNLIIKLTEEGRLNEYYVGEKQILEHFRFKDKFIRRTKKAFISFIPEQLNHEIGKSLMLNKYSVQTKVKRKTKALKFGDIRELHGSLSTRHLSESEIDFLHGRVSSSVFMRNYFNPALIDDLKTRIFNVITEIQKRV